LDTSLKYDLIVSEEWSDTFIQVMQVLDRHVDEGPQNHPLISPTFLKKDQNPQTTINHV